MPFKRKYQRIMDNSSENEGQYKTGTRTVSSSENRKEVTTQAKAQDDSTVVVASGDITLLSPVVIHDGQDTVSSISPTNTMGKPPDLEEDEDISITEVDLTHEDEKEKAPLCRRLKGIFAVLLATSMVALNNEILYYVFDDLKVPYSKSRFLTHSYLMYCVLNYVPLQIVMYKDFDGIIKPLKDDKKSRWLLVVRGFLGSTIQFVTSHAIDRLKKPAPVSVITAMAPIVVYINAYFVLKEKLGIIPIVNVFVAIAGVIVMNLDDLILHEGDSSTTLEGTGLALTAMLILSWVIVIIRLLRQVNPYLLNMAFGVCGVLVQGIVVLFEDKGYVIDQLNILGLCFASAAITTLGNFSFNVALKYESAGVVSLVRTSEVVFSFVFQFCFFELKPEVNTALGGAMIVFGVICVTMRKIVGESSETSKLRKYLWFLLY